MKIFSSDIAVLEGPAYAFPDQVLAIMLGLGSSVHGAETSSERLVYQIGGLIFLPSGTVD